MLKEQRKQREQLQQQLMEQVRRRSPMIEMNCIRRVALVRRRRQCRPCRRE